MADQMHAENPRPHHDYPIIIQCPALNQDVFIFHAHQHRFSSPIKAENIITFRKDKVLIRMKALQHTKSQ